MKECDKCQPQIDTIAQAWETAGPDLQNKMVLENISTIRTALQERGLCPGLCVLLGNWFSRGSDRTPPHEE